MPRFAYSGDGELSQAGLDAERRVNEAHVHGGTDDRARKPKTLLMLVGAR